MAPASASLLQRQLSVFFSSPLHHRLYPRKKSYNMSLSEYLAQNYLTADPSSAPSKSSSSKKRKRAAAPSSSLTIVEDSLPSYVDPSSKSKSKKPSSTKTSLWKRVGAAPPTDTAQREADAIIAQTAAERAARAAGGEDAPMVVDGGSDDDEQDDDDDDDDDGPVMANGAKAGLQSGAQVSAALRRKDKAERKRLAAALSDDGARTQQTIYRDGTGRVANAALMRAQAVASAEEKAAAKKKNDADALLGDAQRAETLRRRDELVKAQGMGLARYADDEELNAEMRAEERWNDPAAKFLSERAPEKKSVTGKALYKGSFEPNRYGMRPGRRWDGVDRGNGFEKRWFQARNEKENKRNLEYSWEMDD